MITVLFASPRKKGNTWSLLEIFLEEASKRGLEYRVFSLYDRQIESCQACLDCQEVEEDFGCPLEDDMEEIFESILRSRLIIFASPIYSWYTTPPLKAAMDRLVYGMNKYYGSVKANLWQGKALAGIFSCGYPVERGTDLLDEGLKRYARHSRLVYLGSLGERDPGYGRIFMDEDKKARMKAFSKRLLAEL